MAVTIAVIVFRSSAKNTTEHVDLSMLASEPHYSPIIIFFAQARVNDVQKNQNGQQYSYFTVFTILEFM